VHPSAEPSPAPPAARRDVRLRDLPLPALLPLWLAIGYVMFFVVRFYVVHDAFGGDAHAYWLTAHRDHLYVHAPTERDAYLYSPAFAQFIWPIAALPWPAFFTIWSVLEAVALAWLLVPLGWRLGVPVFMLCGAEFALGEINVFLAVAAVVGMTRAQAWAFPLLTKIAPGLGPLWFLVRREWRQLVLAVATTVIIAAVSFALMPGEWTDWVRFLRHHSSRGTLFFPVRAALAVVLTIFAARTDRRWLLPCAMLLAAPVVHNAAVPTVLAAIPRLRASQRAADGPDPSGAQAALGPA
jgi:hypothetical protein